METMTNILGCSFSICYNPNLSEKENEGLSEYFRLFLWDTEGLVNALKPLNRKKYGKDMELILFQFEVNPVPYLLEHLKEIENYRKKEKAIGIPIIVNDENFFNTSEKDRYNFIKTSIMQKMDLLEDVVKKKKLDTNMELLKKDLREVLSEWQPQSA
ncbi:MAG: hypothetical protein LBO74_14525 [Candidatus Symbiothrix sp.]|jgi:hypothetical protein|nr:hypothetical protein [Candidatus Symbiothrix sp.]